LTLNIPSCYAPSCLLSIGVNFHVVIVYGLNIDKQITVLFTWEETGY